MLYSISPRNKVLKPYSKTPRSMNQYKNSDFLLKLKQKLNKNEEVQLTTAQFLESLQNALNNDLYKAGSDDWQKYLCYRKAFAKIAEKFGFLGGINKVKEGYDELIDKLYEECCEIDKKKQNDPTMCSSLDLLIQQQQDKLDKKRMEFEKLETTLDFTINDLKAEYEQYQNDLIDIQKNARELQRLAKDKTFIHHEQLEKINQKKEELENIKQTKEEKAQKLCDLIELEKQKHKELDEFLQVVYGNARTVKSKEKELEQKKKELEEKSNSLAKLNIELEQVCNSITSAEQEIKTKNELFEKRQALISKMQAILNNNE